MKLLIYNPDQEEKTTYKTAPKQKVVVSGIYKIECTYTNSVYIGQSTNIIGRLGHHLSELRAGRHIVPEMQSDYIKYPQYFIFEEIERIDDQSLLKWETFYISQFKENGFTIYNRIHDTEDNSIVNCPAKYQSLISKLIKAIESGRIKAEDIERGLLNSELY